MTGNFALVTTLLVWLAHITTCAQVMQGQIFDATTGSPLADVNILNIHTEDGMRSGDEGKFTVTVTGGQLVEFRKIGYKIIRVRVPNGTLPPFFKVGMEQANVQLPAVEVNGIAQDYKSDSARYAAIYKHTLEIPEMSPAEMMRSPFSALSKRNRQIWAFQKEYELFQQQKFIDYAFNEKVINNITGLKGDSASVYLKMFRPTYDQLRSMNEYTFYTYVKRTVELYRARGARARMGTNRGTR